MLFIKCYLKFTQNAKPYIHTPHCLTLCINSILVYVIRILAPLFCLKRRPKNVFQRCRGFAYSFLFQISLKRSPFILQQLYDELLIRKCFGTHPMKKVILRNWRLSEISSVSQRASGSLYYCLSTDG